MKLALGIFRVKCFNHQSLVQRKKIWIDLPIMIFNNTLFLRVLFIRINLKDKVFAKKINLISDFFLDDVLVCGNLITK